MTTQQIRDFAEKVEWLTVKSAAYFMFGKADNKDLIKANFYLSTLNKAKTKELRLKRIPGEKAVYAHSRSRKNRVGSMMFDHDEKIRCVLGKIANTYPDLMDHIEMTPPHDSLIGEKFFELDNGNMTDRQLTDKVSKYMKRYEGKAGQLIFIMASPYKDRKRPLDKLLEDEKRRSDKLFSILRELIPEHPNRVLVGGFEQFLSDMKLYNHKGKEYDFSEVLPPKGITSAPIMTNHAA